MTDKQRFNAAKKQTLENIYAIILEELKIEKQKIEPSYIWGFCSKYDCSKCPIEICDKGEEFSTCALFLTTLEEKLAVLVYVHGLKYEERFAV